MKKIFVLLVFVLALSSSAFADREARYVREEASRRNMKLITIEQVKSIVMERAGSEKIRFKEFELEDEGDDYSLDFRPIYSVEFFVRGQEYDAEVDAVTGEILKYKRDD